MTESVRWDSEATFCEWPRLGVMVATTHKPHHRAVMRPFETAIQQVLGVLPATRAEAQIRTGMTEHQVSRVLTSLVQTGEVAKAGYHPVTYRINTGPGRPAGMKYRRRRLSVTEYAAMREALSR